MTNLVNTAEIKKRLRKIHKNRFKVLSKFISWDEKMKFKCECGESWWTKPQNLLNPLRKAGCWDCTVALRNASMSKPKNLGKNIEHKYLNELKKKKVKALSKVTRKIHKGKFKCRKDHVWESTLGQILNSEANGCSACRYEKVSAATVKRRAEENIKKTKDYKKYLKSIGISCNDEIIKYTGRNTFICDSCNHNWVARYEWLKGCPKCAKSPYSKIAVEWLDHEAKKRGIKIEHAKNGGEFIVPGTMYRADGYNKRLKLVFEYDGDNFHGNPKLYKPNSHPNHFQPNMTAKQLYKSTLKKRSILKKLGYKVVSIWDSEWRVQREN